MEALSARSESGLLWLTLDTRGSDVSVCDLSAAMALAHALTIDSPLAQRSLTPLATVTRPRGLVLEALEAPATGGRDVWT